MKLVFLISVINFENLIFDALMLTETLAIISAYTLAQT